MACDAYLNFDGARLVEMADARRQAEKELETREVAVREAMVVAKRTGEQAKEIELRHQEGALDKERGEALVKGFLLPILTELAQKKGGSAAVPIVDENYQVNPNPRVLQIETWKRLYVPGYGPAPKTPAQLAAEAQAGKQRLRDRATQLGWSGRDIDGFVTYAERARAEWRRASELDSPAPRGHFLRAMGQSDRDFVENANGSAAIPQALLLMNSELISPRGLLSPYSPLMQFVNRARTPEEQMDAAYLALLARHPTPDEKAAWNKARTGKTPAVEDLIYALLNTRQFLFIQ